MTYGISETVNKRQLGKRRLGTVLVVSVVSVGFAIPLCLPALLGGAHAVAFIFAVLLSIIWLVLTTVIFVTGSTCSRVYCVTEGVVTVRYGDGTVVSFELSRADWWHGKASDEHFSMSSSSCIILRFGDAHFAVGRNELCRKQWEAALRQAGATHFSHAPYINEVMATKMLLNAGILAGTVAVTVVILEGSGLKFRHGVIFSWVLFVSFAESCIQYGYQYFGITTSKQANRRLWCSYFSLAALTVIVGLLVGVSGKSAVVTACAALTSAFAWTTWNRMRRSNGSKHCHGLIDK